MSVHFLSANDITKVMESMINKMTQTYTSAMAILKELVDALQLKASSDLDQIKSKISSQASTIEKFLTSTTLEAKDFVPPHTPLGGITLNYLMEKEVLLKAVCRTLIRQDWMWWFSRIQNQCLLITHSGMSMLHLVL